MSEHIPAPWLPAELPALPKIAENQSPRSEVERRPEQRTARKAGRRRLRYGPLWRYAAMCWAVGFVEARVSFVFLHNPFERYRLFTAIGDMTGLSPALVYSGLMATMFAAATLAGLFIGCRLVGDPQWSEICCWARGDPAPRND